MCRDVSASFRREATTQKAATLLWGTLTWKQTQRRPHQRGRNVLNSPGPSQGWQTAAVSRSTHLSLLGQAVTRSYAAFSRNLREWLGDLEMDPRGLKILSPEHPWCRSWWPVCALTMIVTAREPQGTGAEEGIQVKGLERSAVESTLLLQGLELNSQHPCEVCTCTHTHTCMNTYQIFFLKIHWLNKNCKGLIVIIQLEVEKIIFSWAKRAISGHFFWSKVIQWSYSNSGCLYYECYFSKTGWVWWHTSVIPALRMLRWDSQGQPRLPDETPISEQTKHEVKYILSTRRNKQQ